jgi:hypothetical protein
MTEEGKKAGSGSATTEDDAGETIEKAIVIRGAANHVAGVQAEYQWLEGAFGRRGRDWKLQKQSLLESGGRRYDQMDIELADGTRRTVFFDITEFFGKW